MVNSQHVRQFRSPVFPKIRLNMQHYIFLKAYKTPFHRILKCLLVAIIVTLGACSKKNHNQTSFTNESFKNVIHLTNGNIYENDNLLIGYPLWMKFHPDSFLIIQDYGTPKLLKIIDLKSNQIQELISEGRGPGEMLMSWGMEIIDKDVYAFCPMLKKVIVLAPNLNRQFLITKEIMLDSFEHIVEFCPLKKDQFLCLNAIDESRITFLNAKGEIIRKMGDYPPFQSSNDIKGDNDIFQSSVASSPDGDKIVLACKRTDVIEIFKLPIDKFIRIQGPIGIKLTVIDQGIAKSLQPSYMTYYVLSTNKDEFWVSFSGYQNVKGKQPSLSEYLPKQILCFNWEGQPLRKILLDYPFGGFDIDWTNRTLYTLELHKDYPQLVSYQLDN